MTVSFCENCGSILDVEDISPDEESYLTLCKKCKNKIWWT